MNAVLSLHDQANESFIGRLHDALSQLRSGADCVSQTVESDAGRPPLRAHAAGTAEPGSDIVGGEVAVSGPNCYGVMCPQHGKCARYAAVDGALGTPHTIGTCDTQSTGVRPLFVLREVT